MKKACVILAEGFEEVEGLTPIDYLRRAGIEVLVLGLGGLKIQGSHSIQVMTDASLDATHDDFDAVILPGGSRGAENLAASPIVTALVKRHFAAGRLVAAICAAPAVVLHGACGILAGKRFTGYPGTESRVSGAIFVTDRVVQDANLITSRSAGCAGEFSYAIVNYLEGETAADELAEKVLLS